MVQFRILRKSFCFFYFALLLSSCLAGQVQSEKEFLEKILEGIKKEDPSYFKNSLVTNDAELKMIHTDSTNLIRLSFKGKEVNQLQENLNKIRKNKHKFYAYMYKRIPDWSSSEVLDYSYKYIPLHGSTIPTKEFNSNKNVRFILELRMKGKSEETFLFVMTGIRFKDGYYKLTDLLKSLSE